ncbi:hypothetical protein [Rhodococcus sp. ABRD24]|uniref:hypothetical protein n=1 Tax=Rhodococcus sp. ABRD24 TaxID=2507582 RepID=UPI0013F1736C|nr:hypothetical protein [Rhodococcus sp. ABRD24]
MPDEGGFMARVSWREMSVGELGRAWWDYERHRMRWGLPILAFALAAAMLLMTTGR